MLFFHVNSVKEKKGKGEEDVRGKGKKELVRNRMVFHIGYVLNAR
jgi:hypothetical protein